MLVITVLFMNGAHLGLEAKANTMGYENRLFDKTRVHTIDIVMDDWDSFIKTAANEEYSAANVVIDGEAYKNVAIRGKGNTSLSTVSSMNSSRYSFKIEFDHYDSAITYHGLDKLSLNNLIQDSTMMKDYLTYTMMDAFGAYAPLCSFVYITVNGEDWGLYLAVEGIEDSFLMRNFGSVQGELYKPDSMSFGGGRGNGLNFRMDDFMNSDKNEASSELLQSAPQMPSFGNFDFTRMPMDFGSMPDMNAFMSPEATSEAASSVSFTGGASVSFTGGFSVGGMGSSDVKLQYISDDPSDYSNIWNNAKTDITAADQARLIESIKKLSAGEDIASVVDIEQVIRYFVVHNYVSNGDSYTGFMIHNYYLYEENSKMSMIPWDYNLAYGTFQGGNAQSTVNTPIDLPVSGGSGEDRPMWHWILSDEAYTEMYHRYFEEFLNTVDIVGIINNARSLISPYVLKDPTAFYSYEEFEKGVDTLTDFCKLRSESISKQLSEKTTAVSKNYVSTSSLSLSDMGSMSGMGGFGKMPGQSGIPTADSNNTAPKKTDADASAAAESKPLTNESDKSGSAASGTEQSPDTGNMPQGFDSSQIQNSAAGTMPQGFDFSQVQGGANGTMPQGFDFSQVPGSAAGTMPQGFDFSQVPGGANGTMPQGFDFSGIQGNSGGTMPQDSDAAGIQENNSSQTQISVSDETSPLPTASPSDAGTNNRQGKIDSRTSRGGMQIPGGDWAFNMGGMNSTAGIRTDWIWLAVSAAVLTIGLVIAKLYKKY